MPLQSPRVPWNQPGSGRDRGNIWSADDGLLLDESVALLLITPRLAVRERRRHLRRLHRVIPGRSILEPEFAESEWHACISQLPSRRHPRLQLLEPVLDDVDLCACSFLASLAPGPMPCGEQKYTRPDTLDLSREI